MEQQLTEIEIDVADGDFSDNDPRWRIQRLELFAALREAPHTTLRPPIGSGRGRAETVVVALGSPGAFTTMIEICKAWIGGRPNRRVTLRSINGDSTWEYTQRTGSAP